MSFENRAMKTIFNKNIKMIPTQFTSLFNGIGISVVIPAFALNIKSWFFGASFNQFLTILLTVFSILFLIMKMYDQYITTKLKRQKMKGELNGKA